MLQRFKFPIFSAVAVLLCLGVMEAGLRLLGAPPSTSAAAPRTLSGPLPDHYAADPVLGWRQRPGVIIRDPVYDAWVQRWGGVVTRDDVLRTNSLGFRDTEPASPRPEAQVRLLALGDSSVFGVGAARSATYAERLERALGAPWSDDPSTRAVEVFNAGVSGYSSYQSLIQLEESLPLGLDGVLFYNQNSDMMDAVGASDSEFYGGLGSALAEHPLRRLALWRWLSWGLKATAAASDRGSTRLRVRVEDYEANLRRLVLLSQTHGFGLIFIIPPAASDVVHPEPPERYRVSNPVAASRARAELDRVAAATDWWEQKRVHYRMAMALVGYEAGAPVVDGPSAMTEAYLSDYQRYSDSGALFADELHPSSVGHGVLADAIAPSAAALVKQARASRAP